MQHKTITDNANDIFKYAKTKVFFIDLNVTRITTVETALTKEHFVVSAVSCVGSIIISLQIFKNTSTSRSRELIDALILIF